MMLLDILAAVTLLATLAAVPRLIIGPSPADRIMAMQLSATGTVATLIVLGARSGGGAFFDIALVFAALAAVTGLAFVTLDQGDKG